MNNKAKKQYGQNFLEDTELLENIIKNSNITDKDNIIEIGPGRAFLTENLVKEAAQVTAFEIDNDLIPYLIKKFEKNENFDLIHTDFMNYDLNELFTLSNKQYKVVANIPYYITSPIINKLIKHKDNITEIYLMVQKEVAKRICAIPKSKDMSILSHSVQFFAETSYLMTVNKELFSPIPKVDSAFIKIKIFEDKRYENQITEEKYFYFLKKAFSSKRKSIVNNLNTLDYSKNIIEDKIVSMGKTKLARAEEFSVQEFINLINLLESS